MLNMAINHAINFLDPRSNYRDIRRFTSQLNFLRPYLPEPSPDEKCVTLEYGAGKACFSKLLREYYGDCCQYEIVEPSTIWELEYAERGLVKVDLDTQSLEPSSYTLMHAPMYNC